MFVGTKKNIKKEVFTVSLHPEIIDFSNFGKGTIEIAKSGYLRLENEMKNKLRCLTTMLQKTVFWKVVKCKAFGLHQHHIGWFANALEIKNYKHILLPSLMKYKVVRI
ncbi:hypothetical protein [Ascidiimonas sp. W6]|uniref:hypothetical protein n=1 Tax=Ascidiimonas meishanensis TaxID=3128903 RepID=UPI0030EC9801